VESVDSGQFGVSCDTGKIVQYPPDPHYDIDRNRLSELINKALLGCNSVRHEIFGIISGPGHEQGGKSMSLVKRH
jgi:hypothetical protein